MAAQISHDGLNNTESTGASAPVDVAANPTATASTEHGINEQAPTQTKTDDAEASQHANEHATDVNAITSAVEPSAGEAVDMVAETTSIASETNAVEDTGAVDIPLTNGTSDGEGSIDASSGSEPHKDDMHHVRSNSVKKPTSFLKVSATKNFLSKTAATPAAAKPIDKPAPAGTLSQATLAAKPRLIAKTGTALRDIQKARMSADPAGAPDASKVWNKNRPVAPPPPKQFTDEELKQQYGIHLATRLQTDEDGKESKWADIDDDEDDWAPETVVWMDGTKSSLTPQEAVAVAPLEKQKQLLAQPPKPAEGTRPILALKKATELGPPKTILKPGAGAAAVQAKQNGVGGILADKPSLKAKSPAANPNKSPWAVLPPVEKVSPINPPVQQSQPPSFVSQDARTYEPSHPPQPAREIAADTFDRSWREGEGGGRELFNAANGRYEPAPEGRRTSVKPDSVRKPAVLQRPSQSSVTPAEPSAAFQSRTSSQMDGSWGRRRGSSVSQGSLPPGRRVSVSKTSDMSPAQERRPSIVVGHDMRASPRMARNELAQPAFAQQSTWQQQMPPQPEASQEQVEDPVQVQDRVMKEKRERAKLERDKKRREEEDALEAAKQERLRAKLASLSGAGKSKKDRDAEAAAAAAAQTPSSNKPPQSVVVEPQNDETSARPVKPSEAAALVAPALEAQALPSVPEASKDVQPLPEDSSPLPIPSKPQAVGLPDRPVSSDDQGQRQPPRTHLSPRANVRAPFQQGPYRPPTSSYSSPGDRKQPPFGRSPLQNNDAFSPWPTTTPSGNVWGTSSGIGNGTFENANGFAPMPMSQQGSALPPPPGMSRPSTSTRISPQSLNQDARSPNLQQDASRGFAPPGFEPRPDPFASQGRVNGTSPAPGLGRQAHLPGPIAPPSRAQQQQQPAQRPDPVAAWNTAAQRLPHEYRSDADAADRRKQEVVPTAPREDTIKETFKQTSVDHGRLGGPRKFEKTEYTVHDAQGSRSVQSLSPAPPNAQTQPSGPFSTASPLQQNAWGPNGESTVRIPDGSLNPAHGGSAIQQPPIGPPSTQQQAPTGYQSNVNFTTAPLSTLTEVAGEPQSPPPPETPSHPAFSDIAGRPRVNLPHGKPVVRLPPAPSHAQFQMPPHGSVAMPPRPISNWGPPGSTRPIVQNEDWQARFNGLFNRVGIQTETPPSPPKTPPKMQSPALAVASSSRTVMDDVQANASATVSLPQAKKITSPEGFTIDESQDVVSKPMIEQMFNDELSFGSAPTINIPRRARYNLGGKHNNMLNSRFMGRVESQSIARFEMRDVHPQHGNGYYVHMPQSKLVRKHVRASNGNRQTTGGVAQDERKASGKHEKAKGKEGVPASPITNGIPNAGPANADAQKGLQPPPMAGLGGSRAGGETGRKSSWAKPPKAHRGGYNHNNNHRPPPVHA